MKKGGDELLAAWRLTLLCCPCLFRKVETQDELHQLSIQFREDLAQAFASMRYTAVQKMLDVKSVMARKIATTGSASVEQVAKYYSESIRFAENSKAITYEFVDCSMTVLKRLMSIPKCSKIVLDLEEQGVKNPLDSIYKLHKIVTRAGTADKIEWAFELMVDLWRSGAIHSDQLGVRHMDGKGQGANGKGIVDLLCFKRDLLRHLTGDFVDGRAFTTDQKQHLRDICCNGLESFRKQCGYVYNTKFLKAATNILVGVVCLVFLSGASLVALCCKSGGCISTVILVLV